jgi:hypothetical protein
MDDCTHVKFVSTVPADPVPVDPIRIIPVDPVHVDPISVTSVNPNPMATTPITLIGCALIAHFELIHRTVKMTFVPQFNLPRPREVFAVF